MRSLKKKISALVLTSLFASMQIAMANFEGVDVGLGNEFGGSKINNATSGLKDVTGIGTGNVGLDFNANTHINWDSLNVGKNESLNFNAVDGQNGLTILNTVNKGMTNVYGQINANDGIAKLIIANPNGMLFDGSSFTAAGDVMLTTKDLSNMKAEDLANLDLTNSKFSQIYNDKGNIVGIKIENSNFEIGGEYNIVAPAINAIKSTLNAGSIKLVTSNGQDYLALGTPGSGKEQLPGVRMEAVNIDGDVYITAPTGRVTFANGGKIDGNLNVDAKGAVSLNYNHGGEKLVVTKDVNTNTTGQATFLRNAEVQGNLKMASSGGFVDIGDVTVNGNADLKTTGINTSGNKNFNHFVHVIGNTDIGGNLNVDSSQNIHIGGYDYDAKQLADGKLTVGGDLTAHAHDGHIMTTIDTSADKISLKSDNYNVLTDGKATLTANEYDFSANGYIGGLKGYKDYTVDDVVITVMENYKHINNSTDPAYINIAGGNVTGINTPTAAYIASNGDMSLTGADAGNIYLTSYGNDVNITGNVHADNITVGGETDKLKVDYPSRDYNLTYTNIRDNAPVQIKGDEEITYNLTNGTNGYNRGEQIKGENTYLVGPEGPGGPDIPPDPTPEPGIDPDDNENVKVLRSFENQSVNLTQVYTPVAYAADLDDDEIDKGVRKNVDGSVTVVRAYPMGK